MHAIEVANVTKIFRKGFRAVRIPAVVDLSFTVRKGAITGFVGPNGAGKTTTIKMIEGLVHPTKGMLRINGEDAAFPRARGGVAFLSEQPYFYAHLTVSEMLRFTAELIRVPSSQIPKETQRVLETVELSRKTGTKIKELSKGMQQRLNMAQALLGSPHTLVLDEPMSGMDPPGRRLFRDLMELLRQEGRTLFFSSHVLDDIEAICDDVVVLQQGKLTYAGGVRELLDEGFTGTDVVTGEITQECREALGGAGCRFRHDEKRGEWTLFVPKTGDVAALQRILSEKGAFPRRVIPRSMTLEELLYQRKTESVT
ncbi:MAG: ABC transporter ATP-binding protein [Chitinispirillaceae bacterium]|nr:ABC transporter ATP-binding protein [Chitinispirillaceae bacterium]